MNNTLINIFLFFTLISSLMGAVWFWARDNLKKKVGDAKAKDARKDADIANKPNKRGSALLDSLSNSE